MRRYSALLFTLLIALVPLSFPKLAKAASSKKKTTISVNYSTSGIEDVDLIRNDGTIDPGVIKGSKIKFTVPANKLNGSSLIAFKDGQLVGSIGVVKSNKLRFRISGAPKDKNNQTLSKFTIKLNSWTQGTPYASTSIKGKIFSAKGAVAISKIKNLGINIGASESVKNVDGNKIKIKAISGAAVDSDGDSFPDLYDTDADGDGIIDIADSSIDTESSESKGISKKDIDTGVALPFTTLFLPLSDTVNWHIGGSLNQEEIDSIIGGENLFSIAFYFGFPGDGPNSNLATDITGAFAVCPNELEYCRSTSVGASTGIYSGFSEGSNSIKGQLWSSLTESGQENSLENLPSNDSGAVWAAAIQPRVGTTKFRPGDTYRVDFVNSSNSVISRKSLTLPPYFVTVPALRAYNITDNDSTNDVLIDYADSSGPGTSNGNPIIVPTSGPFTGKLRFNIWRLQRAAVSGLESGEYRDFGHLNYGVMINNNSGEFSCGELYEDLSSTLTELPSQGQGGSYSSSNGALLWPLVDSADDYEPSNDSDSTTIGNNTVSFTVDLTSCLTRNSLSPGTHQVTITAAGADTGHGNNRAAQIIHVTIP